jgi:hypothetical protein
VAAPADLIFLRRPIPFLDGGIEVIEPPLSTNPMRTRIKQSINEDGRHVVASELPALFADAARELSRDHAPLDVANTMLHDHLRHDRIFLLCPGTLQQSRLQHLYRDSEYERAAGEWQEVKKAKEADLVPPM